MEAESNDASGTRRALTCASCYSVINMDHNWETGNLMIYLKLTDQLQHLFEQHHDVILSHTTREKKCEYAIEDIFDGTSYPKNLLDNMISLNINIDGTPVSKSSPISVYPVLCQ